MARRVRVTICSSCLNEFPDKELYTVEKEMHKGHPGKGFYRTPYCSECIKDTDSYVKISKEPKAKK